MTDQKRERKLAYLKAKGWSENRIVSYMRGWDMAGQRIAANKKTKKGG